MSSALSGRSAFELLSCLLFTGFAAALEQEVVISSKLDLRALSYISDKKPVYAAIYSYGAIVEQIGPERAAKKGYDIDNFGRELAGAGLWAVIPLRDSNTDGVEAILAAHRYLISKGVSENRIALIGFSKGGGLTLKAAARLSSPGPVVLMSPALIDDYAGDFKLLKGKVLLTLGKKDPDSIRDRVLRMLAPLCHAMKDRCDIKAHYPGNHKWFWAVREQYWQDIKDFLEAGFSPI